MLNNNLDWYNSTRAVIAAVFWIIDLYGSNRADEGLHIPTLMSIHCTAVRMPRFLHQKERAKTR